MRGGLKNRFTDFGVTLAGAFRRRRTWLGLGFALIAAAAFEATGALAGPFLVDEGVEQEVIGKFCLMPVVAALLVGGIVGGKIADVVSRTKAIAMFLVGFVAVILALAVIKQFFPSLATQPVLFALLTAMYFFVGLFTASSYALFMDLTDPKLGATQFSTFMAATNGCESWAAAAGGQIVARAGYPAGFAAMCLISLLSLPLLSLLRRHGASRNRDDSVST